MTSSHETFDPRIFHKQARTLTDSGYDVTLVTNHPGRDSRDGIEIISAGQAESHLDKALGLRRMYQTAKAVGAEVYHFHDPGLLPVGATLAYQTDAAVVYDCHEDYARAFQYYNFPPDLLTPPLVALYPRLQSMLTKGIDGIVAATDWIAADFRDRGHEEVSLVRNFPKVTDIQIGEPPAIPQHDQTLVYVGSLSEQRGLFDMLRLVDELQIDHDVGLWLIGHFPREEVEDRAKRFVESHGLHSIVRFFGYVDHAEIFSYLAAADVGLALLDSKRAKHIIPTKAFEYMYTELPVIATETPATRRYLSENYGLLVTDKDRQARADAVSRLLSDPERIRSMGRSGRKKVESEYCWEQEETELLNLYERILTR